MDKLREVLLRLAHQVNPANTEKVIERAQTYLDFVLGDEKADGVDLGPVKEGDVALILRKEEAEALYWMLYHNLRFTGPVHPDSGKETKDNPLNELYDALRTIVPEKYDTPRHLLKYISGVVG